MYRRPQPPPSPQRSFKVRLKSGHIVVSATKLLVAIHHFPEGQREPDYTIHLLVEENPELAQLYHPLLGWDLVSLVGLLWRKLDILKTLDLRDPALRAELGLSTVSVPSQTRKRQEKRSMEEALQMIRDFVLEHPNCTRLEISRHMGRAKNPYIIAQIEWLVIHGELARSVYPRPNGVPEYRYIFIGNSDD